MSSLRKSAVLIPRGTSGPSTAAYTLILEAFCRTLSAPLTSRDAPLAHTAAQKRILGALSRTLSAPSRTSGGPWANITKPWPYKGEPYAHKGVQGSPLAHPSRPSPPRRKNGKSLKISFSKSENPLMKRIATWCPELKRQISGMISCRNQTLSMIFNRHTKTPQNSYSTSTC